VHDSDENALMRSLEVKIVPLTVSVRIVTRSATVVIALADRLAVISGVSSSRLVDTDAADTETDIDAVRHAA